MLLQGYHHVVQTLLEGSELQPEVPQPLVGEPVRLGHRLAVIFTPATHARTPLNARRYKSLSGEESKQCMHGWKLIMYVLVGDGVLREKVSEQLEEMGTVQHGAHAEVPAA